MNLEHRSTPQPDNSSLAVCTIVAKSHLPYARVLVNSFHEHHPEIPFFVLLADKVDGYLDVSAESFHPVQLMDLPIPNLGRFCFPYAKQPLSYAATPYLIAHLLQRGFQKVIFLKQESLIVGDLTPAFKLLEQHSILLTPHLLAPLQGGDKVDRELNILQSGVFNIGMIGVSETPSAHKFLSWWQDRVYTHCRHAIAEGMHYEQRWIDLAPALFEDVHLLRDPTFNVGHWNLPERTVEVRNKKVLVSGHPCRLIRFSGFDPNEPDRITKYISRLAMDEIGDTALLFDRYRRELEAAGYRYTMRWPYSYDRFDNQVPIPDIARELYLELGDKVTRFGDPFQTANDQSFYRWLNDPVDSPAKGIRPITQIWHGIYRRRPDLRQAYPDLFGANREAFLEWTKRWGLPELDIHESFLVN